MNDESASSSSPQKPAPQSQSSPGEIRFPWPPPGLEGVQGVLWPASGIITMGGLLLVFPLLWSVGRKVPFYSLGPFGDTWWVLILTSLAGLLLVLSGLGTLFRFFRTGRKAGRLGISAGTILMVGADGEGDMGFLLQGARAFQVLEGGSRERMARARVWGTVLYLLSALWVSFGFFLSVFLAARGILGPRGLWVLTLGPVAAFLLGGLGARAYQGLVRRRAAKGPGGDPWKDEEFGASVREWRARRGEAGAEQEGERGGILSAGAVGVVVLGVLVALPAFTLTLTNSVGPILASIAVPNFNQTQERAARVEVYRRYRLEGDPSVTPLAAGEALANLAGVGEREEVPLLKVPPIQYEDDFWWADQDEPFDMPAREWAHGLFPRVATGLTTEERTFLQEVAAHPALDQFKVLARASGADFLQPRYVLPFPEGTTAIQLPLPRFSKPREGAYGMVARAALQYLEGREAEAEETLREILSAGFLLGDEGPTLIDNLIGYVLVTTGGEALESFYRVTGREREAETILWGRTVSDQAVTISRAAESPWGAEGFLRQLPATVTSSKDAIRGLRWEFFMLANAMAPCINAHKVVFGPDDDMAAFIGEARDILVRYPSERALFELVQGGWFGNPEERSGVNLLGRLVDLTLGGGGTPGSCASLLSSIQW